MKESWWDSANSDLLEQGHLLTPLVHPMLTDKQLLALPDPGLKCNVTFQKLTAIVLSQSCDLTHDKLKRAVVVKVVDMKTAATDGLGAEDFQEIRDGRRPLWAMLSGPNDPDEPADCMLVDFRWTLSLPITYLRQVAKNMGDRPVLRSPYVEYLSSSFARCFGRVALPIDLPNFILDAPEAEETTELGAIASIVTPAQSHTN